VPSAFHPNSRTRPLTAADMGLEEVSQADRDRLAAEKVAVELAASKIRDHLRELVEFVWAHGRGYADQLLLDDDEKDFLKRQEEGLVSARGELERAVSLIASPKLQYELYRSFWKLLWHGVHMARFAGPIDAMERAQALREAERRSRLGKASGASRKAAAARWQKVALSLAQEIRAANPTLSQDALATRIKDKWKRTDTFLPSHQWTIKFIRDCEKDGTLSRKAQRKRSPD
jgi:hypothetical protein